MSEPSPSILILAMPSRRAAPDALGDAWWDPGERSEKGQVYVMLNECHASRLMSGCLVVRTSSTSRVKPVGDNVDVQLPCTRTHSPFACLPVLGPIVDLSYSDAEQPWLSSVDESPSRRQAAMSF